MTFLLVVLAVVLVAVAVLWGLALRWADTPHGRLKPIFALVFGLSRLTGSASSRGAIGAGEMDGPEATEKIRRDFLKSTAPLSKRIAFRGRIEDRDLEGPGGALPVRIYTPPGAGPFPLLVYFHGGGFVVGSPDYTDAVTRGIARETPAVVVSVDYRMAPEHPFPAAVDDSAFAVDWCFENAVALGARPGPVAVAGDSAGGNLSAVVAQRDLRDGKRRINLQVLIYPCTDFIRSDRESQQAFGSGYGLSMLDVDECFGHYAPPGIDRSDPELSPLLAPSLAGLPRALVFTAGFDLLRDEGTAYAARLAEEGVPVRHVHEPAMPHGYITLTRICREAQTSISQIAEELRAR